MPSAWSVHGSRSLTRCPTTTRTSCGQSAPDVVVLVDGVWCPSEIRGRQLLAGAWHAYVHYSIELDGHRHTKVARVPYDKNLRVAT